MPKYQFHRLPEGAGDLRPVEVVLFDDVAAMRRAMGEAFPDGCDVWQAQRFVGRFHRAVAAAEPETPEEVTPRRTVAG
jgi:hypothetical protein